MIKRRHKVELLIYKYIGVLWFKKIILRFEEIFHVNRGYRLMNYHPEKMTVEGINNFFWLLLYNCILHIISIVLLLLYCISCHIGKIRIVPLNIFLLVLIIFNLYCIFLQRHTYLRLQQWLIRTEKMLNKQYDVQKSKVDAMPSIYLPERMYEDTLNFFDRVEGVFLKESCCFINEDDLCVLEQINNMLCEMDIKLRDVSLGEMLNADSVEGGIEFINPCKRVNIAVEILKYLFNRKMYYENKKNMVLVTETEKCEELYKAIFGDGSTEIELLRIKLLRYIYTNKVQVE